MEIDCLQRNNTFKLQITLHRQMTDWGWITMSFPTPLIFRYYLPLRIHLHFFLKLYSTIFGHLCWNDIPKPTQTYSMYSSLHYEDDIRKPLLSDLVWEVLDGGWGPHGDPHSGGCWQLLLGLRAQRVAWKLKGLSIENQEQCVNWKGFIKGLRFKIRWTKECFILGEE